MQKKRGQVAIEFIIVMSMGLFLACMFIILFGNAYVQAEKDKRLSDYDLLLDVIEDEIMIAGNAPIGYTRVIDTPISINGFNYTLIFANYSLVLDAEEFHLLRLLPLTISGGINLNNTNATMHLLKVERVSGGINLYSCAECEPDYHNCNENFGTLDLDVQEKCCAWYFVCS